MSKQTYLNAARRAAAVEQAGNYQHAAALWGDAAGCTSNLRQRMWCSHRSVTCVRLHELRKGDRP